MGYVQQQRPVGNLNYRPSGMNSGILPVKQYVVPQYPQYVLSTQVPVAVTNPNIAVAQHGGLIEGLTKQDSYQQMKGLLLGVVEKHLYHLQNMHRANLTVEHLGQILEPEASSRTERQFRPPIARPPIRNPSSQNCDLNQFLSCSGTVGFFFA